MTIALAAPAVAAGEPQQPAPPPNPEFSNALEVLTRYIPTEVVTLYVAAVSWTLYPGNTTGFLSPTWTYFGFTILTPVLLLLIFWSKRASAGEGLTFGTVPVWKMVASTIAFGIWALSVPHNPILEGYASGAGLAGLSAMFVSVLLTIVEPIVSRQQ